MYEKIMEFIVFCIDSLTEYLNKDTKEAYKLIQQNSNILDEYIILCYRPLHSIRTCKCIKRKRYNRVEVNKDKSILEYGFKHHKVYIN
mgnify:CR=1 FL=1